MAQEPNFASTYGNEVEASLREISKLVKKNASDSQHDQRHQEIISALKNLQNTMEALSYTTESAHKNAPSTGQQTPSTTDAQEEGPEQWK